MARKYARIFVRGHYLFREANSFPRAKLEENCELRGTDNVQGQISEHIFAPNGDYCLYYPSNLFRNAPSFENWEIFSDIPQFLLWNIRSRDAFRPIARKQKDLMDYKTIYAICCETTSNKTRVSPKHKARVNANMRLVEYVLHYPQGNERTGDIRSSWVNVTRAGGPNLLRLGRATKMAGFGAIFEISSGHRKSRIYPNQKIFSQKYFK